MIYDSIENAETYLGISSNLDRALQEIQKGAYLNWKNGRHMVEGEAVYCNVISLTYAKEGLWERHEKYLDIHISYEGNEEIRVADQREVDGWEPFNAESDSTTAAFSEKGIMFPMRKGSFLIVFPQDAHIPGLSSSAEDGRKAIFKVRIRD